MAISSFSGITSEVFLKAREKNSPRTFSTYFKEDNLIVPWKPIPLGEFIELDNDLHVRQIPFSVIEDEVFKKYVLDDSLIRLIDHLKAGIISTVAQNIWEYSAPTSPTNFNNDIQEARYKINNSKFSAIHAFANILMTAFAYKPEEVFAMDYPTFLTRLMQAEYKMNALGILKEPFCVKEIVPEEPPPGPKFTNLNDRPKVDAKKLWDQQEQSVKQKKKPIQQQSSSSKDTKDARKKWWNVSPVLESKKKQNINFNAESEEVDFMALENEDRHLPKEVQEYLIKEKIGPTKANMVEDAKVIYKDLIEELNKRRKLGK